MSFTEIRPYPDELVMSHLTRFRLWHGMKRSMSVLDVILKRYYSSVKSLSRADFGQALARMAGMSEQEYLREHTLDPFVMFGSYQPWPHGLRRVLGRCTNERFGLCQPEREATYLCPRCVDEDLAVHGSPSYWRRSHQLPGRYWCASHPETQLLAVRHEDALEWLPSTCMRLGKASQLSLCPSLKSDPVAIGFVSMAEAMLRAKPASSSSEHVTSILRRAYSLRGSDDRSACSSGTLLAIAQRMMPRPLWEDVRPCLVRVRYERQTYRTSAGILKVSDTTRLTATAIAAVYTVLHLHENGVLGQSQ